MLAAERGASIVAAIFLLLLLGGLAALMATFSSTQQATSTQDLLGSRAYQAARAGLEWGVYRALQNNTCTGTANLPALADDLRQFTVVVQCTSIPADEIVTTDQSSATVTVYHIVSVATSGVLGTPYYIERRLEVTVS